MNKRSQKKRPSTQIKPAQKKQDFIISPPSNCLFINTILRNRYKILEKIGTGSFGVIYLVEDLFLKEKPNFAMKIENSLQSNAPLWNSSLLQKEAKILENLQEFVGFPKFIEFFKELSYNCLIMTLLGENLEHLLKKSKGRNFSMKTVLMLGFLLLQRLESMHSKGILHRDIKPENIVITRNSSQMDFSHMNSSQMNSSQKNSSQLNEVFLIDFGLSKEFYEENGTHVKMCERKGLIGTVRYASVSAHEGKELGRRDDLESMVYVLVYLKNGGLPWQKIFTNNLAKNSNSKNANNLKNVKKMKNSKNSSGNSKNLMYDKIRKMKENINIDEFLEGFPNEFKIFWRYIKSLSFEESPNYKFIKGLFENVIENSKFSMDFQWDWSVFYEKNQKKETIFSKEIEKLNTFETINKEKIVNSFTNLTGNYEDCEEKDCEERQILRFFIKENVKPKFLS